MLYSDCGDLLPFLLLGMENRDAKFPFCTKTRESARLFSTQFSKEKRNRNTGDACAYFFKAAGSYKQSAVDSLYSIPEINTQPHMYSVTLPTQHSPTFQVLSGDTHVPIIMESFHDDYSAMQRKSLYVFPEKELRGLSPNFTIHVSVSYLCIPRIGPHVFLLQNRQTNRGNM